MAHSKGQKPDYQQPKTVELLIAVLMVFKPAIINWYQSQIHDSLNVDHWFNYVMNYWTMDQDKYNSSDDSSCNIKYLMLIPLVLSVIVLFMAVVMNIIIGHQYLRRNQIDIIGKIIMVYCWYSLEYDENSLLIRDQNILRPRAQIDLCPSHDFRTSFKY